MTAKNGAMIPAATGAKMTTRGRQMLALEARVTRAATKVIAAKLMATTEAGTTTPAVLMITGGIRKGLIQANSPMLQASSKVKHRLLYTYFVPACVPCK